MDPSSARTPSADSQDRRSEEKAAVQRYLRHSLHAEDARRHTIHFGDNVVLSEEFLRSLKTAKGHERQDSSRSGQHRGITSSSERDLEHGINCSESTSSLVTWNGPNDLENPKNWSTPRRWAAAASVSLFALMAPMSSSMIAPALPQISSDLNISSDFWAQFSLSIFVLAFAIGPIFLGPLSEIYGRVIVLQTSNVIYLVFNIACGACQTQVQLIIFRFLAGLGGSAPLAISGAVMGDMFRPEERGKAIAIYSLAPLLGPAVGPILGAVITENISWRWIFYITSALDAIIQVAGLFILRETYAPIILQRKAKQLRLRTGNKIWYTEFDDPTQHVLSILGGAVVRPCRMLLTQPIVQVLALAMAYLYGLLYIVLSYYPVLWTSADHYNESVGIGGLNYLSLGVGFLIGVQICAYIIDKLYSTLKARNGGIGIPEFRIPLLALGSLIIPTGLLIYGWSARYTVFWLVPNIGMALFTGGCIIGFQAIQTYLIDTYTRYVASALAAIVVLRSLAGFAFPLFAPYLFQKLDYGWASSLLAFLAIGVGLPVPALLWFYGERLRKHSLYAAD